MNSSHPLASQLKSETVSASPRNFENGPKSGLASSLENRLESSQVSSRESSRESSFQSREADIRAWVARKESVCPYAPGLARFIQLPRMTSLNMSNVYVMAKELQAFYDAKQAGKRVGRWMLLPHEEWQSHEEAHEECERIFWLLNAAYFYLVRDRKSVAAALNRELTGYNRGHRGEILNPVVGKLPNPDLDVVPAKSLFFTGLSPLYKSKRFYRWSPHCCIPLVYASEFQELKLKHTKVSKKVAFEMAYGGLYEVFGDDLYLNLSQFEVELSLWGRIIDRVAEIVRAERNGVKSSSDEAKGVAASNLSYFRVSDPRLVAKFFFKYADNLPTMNHVIRYSGACPKRVISAAFAGSGLYTMPVYI